MTRALDHHIFTSSTVFETAALSAGIDRETRAVLEARARHYPGEDAAADPPFVVRAFPLSKLGAWAVSLMIDTGPAFDRPRGNYLAHSYVIPPEFIESSGWNLAWVAAHLPIWSGYRRGSTSGPDRIERLPCRIDPDGQFRLVPLLVRDLGRDGVQSLLSALLRHLEGDSSERTLAVRVPPPDPRLAEIIADTLGTADTDAPPVPSPDKRRLWLLVAGLALLPAVFRKKASFSINEIRVPVGTSGGARCAIAVLREPMPPEPPSNCTPWIEFCIAHGERRHLDGLQQAHGWLSAALTMPLAEGLEWAFRLFGALVEPKAGSSRVSAGDVADILRDMAPYGCYDIGTLVPAVRAFEQRSRPNARERMELYGALSTVAARSGDPGHDPVVRELMDCLRPDGVLASRERLAFFRSLEPEVRPQVWRQAEASSRFPVEPRRDERGVALREDLSFLLRIIEPRELGLSRDECDGLAMRMIADLRHSSRDRGGAGAFHREHDLIRTLLELGEDGISVDFGRSLADVVSSYLVEAVPERVGALHLLRSCVQDLLKDPRSNARIRWKARFLAQITLALSRRQPGGIVLELVYSLPESGGALSLLDALIDCRPVGLAQLLSVERERRSFIAGDFGIGHWSEDVPLRCYSSWLDAEAARRRLGIVRHAAPSPEYVAYHEHLAQAMAALPLRQMLQLGAACLRVNPGEGVLLRAVTQRMRASRADLSQLIVPSTDANQREGSSPPRAAFEWIIRVLLRHRSTEELFFSTMGSLLSSLTYAQRGALLESLNASLFELPRSRRRLLREIEAPYGL